MAHTDQVDLLNAFTSFYGFNQMFQNLIPALSNANSATVAVLALEGLFRIEADVKGGQFAGETFDILREYLRKWRCDSPLGQAYSGAFKRVVPCLRSLSIFKALEVPLFIDDYGEKKLLSDYTTHEPPKYIPIDLNTPIVHVTHSMEAKQIFLAEKFQPSANKNIIEGIWFSPKYQLGNPPSSIYGGYVYETTLAKLGVPGLRQGEIVSYKQEINVIVYASDTMPPGPLLRPTDNAVKLSKNDARAYVNVSIFVPSKFLQIQGDEFKRVVSFPYNIPHGPFCLLEKRLSIPPFICTERDVLTPPSWIPPPPLPPWTLATLPRLTHQR